MRCWVKKGTTKINRLQMCLTNQVKGIMIIQEASFKKYKAYPIVLTTKKE